MGKFEKSPQRLQEEARALVVVQPPRLPMPAEAAPLGIDEGQWKALVNAIFPSAKSVDGVILALQYCKSRGLDPFKRPVHIVPMWNTALGREVETVWPGINEIRTTASRTGSHAGNDDCVFGPTLTRSFEASEERRRGQDKYKLEAKCDKFEFPEWAQVTVYRIVQGNRVPFVGPKVRFVEAFSGEKGLRVPNSKWRASPWQMLEKCAEAAALRRAFPEELGNDYTAEEMEGKTFHQDLADHSPVLDGGAANAVEDKRPTRESVAEEAEKADFATYSNWNEVVRREFDVISGKIEKTEDPDDLREAKADVLAKVAGKWPQPAIDEISVRFDTRIKRMQGEVDDDDLVDGETGEITTKEGNEDAKPS